MASIIASCRAQVHWHDTCSLCDSVEEVNWFCNDCQEVMCSKCKEVHQRGKKPRNDDVVPIQKAEKRNDTWISEVCKTHPTKSCDLFCTECRVVMCSMCFTQKHTHHSFSLIEEEIQTQKQNIEGQLNALKFRLSYFNDNISKRREAWKAFKDKTEVIWKGVQAHGLKLKAEVDSIVNSVLVELATRIAEEEESFKTDCKPYEKGIAEIKRLIRNAEHQIKQTSSSSLFELTKTLKNTIPLYDVTWQNILPRSPNFVFGQLNSKQLVAMVGYVSAGYEEDTGIEYEKTDIDSQHVENIATFRVPQKNDIISLCPSDESHAWVAVSRSKDLNQINKKGNVTKTIKLDFEPWCLAMINTNDLLITCQHDSSQIYKLSENRCDSRFADNSPYRACGISVSDSDEVIVTTLTPQILVLNKSGELIRQLSCGQDGTSAVCLMTGNVAVTTGGSFSCNELIIINKSDQTVLRTWSGELDNEQKIGQTVQYSIARDGYDRVFVPDLETNQIYVLSENGGRPNVSWARNTEYSVHWLCV